MKSQKVKYNISSELIGGVKLGRKIADIIEEFILCQLAAAEHEDILLSRNQLAQQLKCAPSQISYVLQSRFTAAKGFCLQSRRGSGGFVKISRQNSELAEDLQLEQEALKKILQELLVAEELSECQIHVLRALQDLLKQETCSKAQLDWVKGALVHIVKLSG